MKFILTADWHLRSDRPRCRLDPDWLNTQRLTVRWVVDLARERDLNIIILGDIFNTPHAGDVIEIMAVQELKRAPFVYLVAGNHDLPYHNYDNVDRCSFGVLRQSFPELNPIEAWDVAPFGRDDPSGKPMAFTHQLVFGNDMKTPPGEFKRSSDMLIQFPDADWIFTGDMHHRFHDIVTQDGRKRHVVNPGCLLRQTADLLEYHPCVAVVDTDAGTVEWVEVPDDGAQMVTDAYLRTEEVRVERTSAFVEAVRTKGDVSLSFRDNLTAKLNGQPEPVRGIVLDLLEQSKKGKSK